MADTIDVLTVTRVIDILRDEFDYVEEVRQACKSLYEASGSVLVEEHKHSARVLVYTKAGYAAMREAYITATSSARSATTPRSCVIEETISCVRRG